MKLANQMEIIRKLGLRTWFQVKVWSVFRRMFGSREPIHFTLPGSRRQPLSLRPDSSDLYVCHQIFVEREYGPFDDLVAPDLVLDCGANLGYSAACFLARFPRCLVIAVEPDPENFKTLQRNLAAFGQRAQVIQAAVWSHPAPLKISRSSYRDGLDWFTRVRECQPGEEADIQAVSIGTLLAHSGRERISLPKMDIEGAEAVVFSDHAPWLDRVDNLAIEIHDDMSFGQASAVVMEAIARQRSDVSKSGDLTFCRRSRQF